MKKLSLFIASILFLIPLSVSAAEPKVKSLDASVSGTKISYNGTMEDGSHAVMCKLYDKESNEIDLLSSAVDNSKFEGSFIVSNKGEYKVACANYEGGKITEKSVVVDEEKIEDETKETEETKTTDKSTTKSPKTGDKIMLYVSLAIISLIGVGYLVIRLKKQLN